MRWWTYAVLAIAVVAGSVSARPSLQTRETCELRECARTPASAARKPSGIPTQVARREASGSTRLAMVPDPIDLPGRSTACTVLAFVVGEGRTTPPLVVACSRAPPSG